MTIRAVIWDLGGVLVRTEDPTPRLRVAQQLGLSRRELEDLVFASEWSDRATLGQISTAELWQSVCARLQLLTAQCSSLQKAFWGGDRLDRDLVAYIRSLHPRLRTGLLSNAFLDLHDALERWDIADAFDQVVISSEVGLMKPDPRVFELALRRLEVAPAEAVFVDDFSVNVRAARDVGLYAVKFLDPVQVRGDVDHLIGTTD
jgi:epoxide hydrolase-like predicted phosphatase